MSLGLTEEEMLETRVFFFFPLFSLLLIFGTPFYGYRYGILFLCSISSVDILKGQKRIVPVAYLNRTKPEFKIKNSL